MAVDTGGYGRHDAVTADGVRVTMQHSPTPWVHDLCIFASDDEFVATAVPFLADSVDAGHATVAVTSAPRCALLRDRLGKAAGEVLLAVTDDVWQGAPRTLDARRQVIDGLCEQSHTRTVHVLAEPSFLASGSDAAARWHAYEAAANHFCAESSVRAVCMYDAERFPAEVIEEGRRTHPTLLAAGHREPSAHYRGPRDYVQRAEAALLAQPVPSTAHRIGILGESDLARARHAAGEHAAAAGLPAERVGEILVAVGELLTNAVVHGRVGATLSVWSEPGTLFCEVADDGGWLEPECPAFPGFEPPAAGEPSGYGLWLVRCLSDGMAIVACAGSTNVRVRFAADPLRQAAASLPTGA